MRHSVVSENLSSLLPDQSFVTRKISRYNVQDFSQPDNPTPPLERGSEHAGSFAFKRILIGSFFKGVHPGTAGSAMHMTLMHLLTFIAPQTAIFVHVITVSPNRCSQRLFTLRIRYFVILKMADPISAASVIITLVTFGIKSSSTLCQTFKEFNNHHKYIRELKGELDALSLVLACLHQDILDNKADFTLLKLPLFRQGSAYIKFNMVVEDTTKQSYGSLASFRY